MKKYVCLSFCFGFLFLESCKKSTYESNEDTQLNKLNFQSKDSKSCENAQFNKVYGGSIDEGIYSLIADKTGGYLFAGWTISNDGNVSGNHGIGDAWIAAIGCQGNLKWKKTLGGSLDESANQIIPAADGGFLFIGNAASSDGDVTGNRSSPDAWVVKFNNGGNIVWQKTFGDVRSDAGASVAATIDGGYVLLIDSDADASGQVANNNVWVIKIDKDGNQLWKTELNDPASDLGRKIIVTGDNGFLLVGSSEPAESGIADAWAVKLDAAGNTLWEKKYGGSNIDIFTSVINTQDGGYAAVGFTNSVDGDVVGKHPGSDPFGFRESMDVWVVKIDAGGNIQWQKPYGGSADDQGSTIVSTANGYAIGGNTFSNDGDVTFNHNEFNDAWLVEVDAGGNLLWQKTYGGTGRFGDVFTTIVTKPGGGYVLGGATNSNDGDITGSHGMQDAWIITASH